MNINPLIELGRLGQSIWLDYISRKLIKSGKLTRLIRDDGLRGMTSNPSIFEKSISSGEDYNQDIRFLADKGMNYNMVYEALSQQDIRDAADAFRQVYDKTGGKDGYVSLEVNPNLAYNTEGTIEEARRLWKAVNRPNIFIKVPGTKQGLPAIRQLISEGININVTLLFGLRRYQEVADAYLSGIEERINQKKPVDHVVSVASFFLSRIDVMVDPLLEDIMKSNSEMAGLAEMTHGETAIACAKEAYRIYKEIFSGIRFTDLSKHGAKTQRLLWASTSTKNPDYSDIKYIEPLIGEDTVNTVPTATLNAYRDHGKPALRLEENPEHSRKILSNLSVLGIDLDNVADTLEEEGVEKFIRPFDTLMKTLEEEIAKIGREHLNAQHFFTGEYDQIINKKIMKLSNERFVLRLLEKDASLWKENPEVGEQIRHSMGWLLLSSKMAEDVEKIIQFAGDIKTSGFRHVLHMGMGGSSLAPLMFSKTFSSENRGLPLTVLDSTDPDAIADIEKKLPLKDTLFIVASKSGMTAEALAFCDYFYKKLRDIRGDKAGENFISITDPGSPLLKLSVERGFRKVFLNFPDIGGRYSALSFFGLVPAALMGVDIGELLFQAGIMEKICTRSALIEENPGILTGIVMAELALHNRNKVTLVTPGPAGFFGRWLEQLLAESTGKEGKGLLPVVTDHLDDPAIYGNDRIFVYFRTDGKVKKQLEEKLANLTCSGHPLITIQLNSLMSIGQEFIRWEIAVAAAGAVLGINPFDQPNVQESKDNTNKLLDLVIREGKLPWKKPSVDEGIIKLYDGNNAGSIHESISEFLEKADYNDYIAVLAYLPETEKTDNSLASVCSLLQIYDRLAVTCGYGPRYLHSTGQYHKGGPNNGIFLIITAENKNDIEIPERSYSFGIFEQAQAIGDLQALKRHKRRILHIHLEDPDEGLALLKENISVAVDALLAHNH